MSLFGVSFARLFARKLPSLEIFSFLPPVLDGIRLPCVSEAIVVLRYLFVLGIWYGDVLSYCTVSVTKECGLSLVNAMIASF